MHLVYDIDLILSRARGIRDLIDNLADGIHSVIRCRVHFYDVYRITRGNLCTHSAFTTRVPILWVFTVDYLSEKLGEGGFPGSPCTAEKIGMAYPF